MAEDDIRALQKLYDAFDRGEIDPFLERLAHDVEWRVPEPLPWGGTHHGHDGARTVMERMREHVDRPVSIADDWLDAGDRIVVIGRFRGAARSSGRDFEARFAHVWALDNGVARQVDVHVDTATVLEALG
jgi:uncharacterized protein